jgi:hypothetical protein
MSRQRKSSQPAVFGKEPERSRRVAQRRRSRVRAIALTVGALAVIGLLVSWSAIRAANRPGEPVQDMGNQHIEAGTSSPVAYNSTPPTSGPHYEKIATWGIHVEVIPDELMVHNLEDGGVGIWYNCPEGCSELVGQLEKVAERYDDGVLLGPYPGMDTQIALTAWTRIDPFDGFDEKRIERFIQAFRGIDHHVRQ